MTKKTLVLNDEPLMHLALSIILDKIPNVQHVATAEELLAQLDPQVACVVVDRGAKQLDLAKIAGDLAKRSPAAGLLVLGAKIALPALPAARVKFTEELHTEREAIAAWIATWSK